MIPPALRDRDKWICWRYGERNGTPTKVPIAPNRPRGGAVTATDSINWTDYETAAQTADYYDHLDGIGYVFHAGGRIVGIDLDDCRVPATGTITDDAQAIIDRLDSYTEVSPSGTGVHIYVKGDKPGDRNQSGDVEIYDGNRFFTVTGNRLEGTPKRVTTAQTELEAVYSEHVAADDTAPSEPVHGSQTTTSDPSTPMLEDQELIEEAKNASGTGDRFRRVWRGDYSHQPSHSEARLELYNYLAYWTGKDEQQMWRLFQQSGLYPHPEDPDKCDRLKDREISKAVADTQNTHDPEYYVDGDKLPDDETGLATADGGRLKVSNPTILRVVEALEELGEASTSEIEEHDAVDRCKRQIRRATKYLEEIDALEPQRDGRSISYSLLD